MPLVADTEKREEEVTLKQTFLTIKQLYGRYFGRGKRSNTLLIILLVTLNLFFVISLATLDTAFSSLIGVLSLPGLSYSLFFQHSLQFVFAATIYQANRFFTSKIGRKIADRLSKEKNFIDKWIDNIGPDYENIDMVQCSASGRRETLYKIFSTFNSFLITLTSGLLSLYKLWLLATPVAFVLFSTPFIIPCYILLASLLYPLAYNVLYSYMSHGYQTTLNQTKEEAKKLKDEIDHVSHTATKKTMKGAADSTKEDFKQLEDNEKKPALRYQALKEILSFIQDLYSEISVAAGIIFSAPMLIAKSISIPTALVISYYFQRVASLFAWTREKNDELATITHDIDTLTKCEDLHVKIFRILSPKKTRPTPPGSPTPAEYIIRAENLYFNPRPNSLPTDPPDLRFYNHLKKMVLRPGDCVEIIGPNKSGKKTLCDILSTEAEEIIEGTIDSAYLKQRLPMELGYSASCSTIESILKKALGEPSDRKTDLTIESICQTVGLDKKSIKKRIPSLNPAMLQRLAIACFLITYPPQSLEGHFPIIFIDNMLYSMAENERNRIIMHLKGTHPSAVILHIHYAKEGLPCYTHRISFDEPQYDTKCKDVSFSAYDREKNLFPHVAT
jgi:ABC-type multidrug transport system fused ATPase/permease subunit